jgi:hypothetical protein
MSLDTQNMKTGSDALVTAQNDSGRKTGKRDLTHSAPPKMSPCAQKMKTEPDALGAAENESVRASH